MTTDENPTNGDELDQNTALSLLADETRVRILEELGDATAAPETGIPRLSYAELQSRVGIRDSGRFNYHLTKLLGHYVAKEADGYRLRWPGMILYRALVAGLFTDRTDPSIDRFGVGTDCHRCGEPLEATLYETLFRVRCAACEATYTDIYFPSHGLVDRSQEAILEAVHRRSRTVLGSMAAGQCPWCARAVSAEIHEETTSLPSQHDTRTLEAYVVYHCTDCTAFQYCPLARVLCFRPVTISFFHDHGVDLTAVPAWELPWAVTDETTTIRGGDPWRATVEIPLADERLVVDLDDELAVVDSRREPRSSR